MDKKKTQGFVRLGNHPGLLVIPNDEEVKKRFFRWVEDWSKDHPLEPVEITLRGK